MQAIDFPHSFLTFRIDTLKKPPRTVTQKPPYSLNNARIPLDAYLTISERGTDFSEEYVLGVSCKTEQVGVEKNIWHMPNADFIPICSSDTFMAIKTYDLANKGATLYPPSLGEQPERQISSIEESFDSLKVDLPRVAGQVLKTPQQAQPREESEQECLGNPRALFYGDLPRDVANQRNAPDADHPRPEEPGDAADTALRALRELQIGRPHEFCIACRLTHLTQLHEKLPGLRRALDVDTNSLLVLLYEGAIEEPGQQLLVEFLGSLVSHDVSLRRSNHSRVISRAGSCEQREGAT